MSKAAAGLIATLALTAFACGPKPTPYYSSVAPDGSTVTLLQRNQISDYSVLITLTDKKGTHTIYSDPIDRSPSPFHVAWTSDSQKVSVLVCNSMGPDLLFNYDRSAGKTGSLWDARNEIARSIQAEYSIPSVELSQNDNDAIRWLCKSPSGARAFERRHRK